MFGGTTMNAVTKLEQLIPLMAMRLPGCPDEVMTQGLRDAWRMFCQRSDWWRPAIDISLVEGETNYALNLPAASHIKRMAFVGLRQQADIDNNLDGAELPDAAYRLAQDDQTGDYTISILWTPAVDATNALRVRPILVPKLATPEPVADWVIERWGDGLVAGTVATLAAMRGKPWSSAQTAGLAQLDFEREVSRARRQNIAGFSDSLQTVRPQRYRPVNTGDSLMPWGTPK